jgi:hypothetical protein
MAQQFDDGLERRRVLSAACIIEVKTRRGRTPVAEYRYQCAFGQVLGDAVLRNEGNAVAGDCSSHQRPDGVEGQLPIDANALGAAVLLKFPGVKAA